VTARNAALTWISVSRRRAIIRKEVSRQAEVSETLVEQSIALAELMKAIYDQASELPPQSRQVFNLIYLEGKSTREIASILSIAPKTVLNYKLTIIQKLRAILLKKGFITSSTLVLLCKKIFF
jgi:RNA polymerase sigma-70 factor (ECF subfamily)